MEKQMQVVLACKITTSHSLAGVLLIELLVVIAIIADPLACCSWHREIQTKACAPNVLAISNSSSSVG
jgi:hypothetical protein